MATTVTPASLSDRPAVELPERLRAAIEPYADRLDVDLIARAYAFGKEAHAGQKRLSGEAYMTHCLEVAKILTELHLDSYSIAAGLIHDVVEDTGITIDVIRKEFGEDVAAIVDGVTKLGKVQFR